MTMVYDPTAGTRTLFLPLIGTPPKNNHHAASVLKGRQQSVLPSISDFETRNVLPLTLSKDLDLQTPPPPLGPKAAIPNEHTCRECDRRPECVVSNHSRWTSVRWPLF